MFDWMLAVLVSAMSVWSFGIYWLRERKNYADYHSSWINPAYLLFLPVSASENLKQRFQALGLSVQLTRNGVFTRIHKHSFNVLGQLEACYLWGHWSIQDNFFDNYSTKINVKHQSAILDLLFCILFLDVVGIGR